MKIVIFGVGGFYCEKKDELLSYTNVVRTAYIDNNRQLHGTYIDGILILAVKHIVELDFDKIILMSLRVEEMKKQLFGLGIEAEKIWTWQRFRGEQQRGSFQFYCGEQKPYNRKKKVLIITTDLNYNGGTLAAVYAGIELKRHGYGVTVAAPGGNNTLINEIQSENLNIMICRALPCLFAEELAFVEQFDIIFVNVFQMICCASEISPLKPVIWWIHEPSEFYKIFMAQFIEYTAGDWMDKVQIYAVSRIAQRNFNDYFPDKINKTLAYGIPDKRKQMAQNKKNTKIVFAIIGTVTLNKGQDIFLEAIKKINKNQKACTEFWIIGAFFEDSYCNAIKTLAGEENAVKFLGEMTRKEIQNAYSEIDVLVCPSREDSLPIVVTEAMMYGKTCIVSDATGVVDYISHGENGLVCKKGDAEDLAEKIKWVFCNKEKLQQIGANARLVYEKYFTMACFGDRLEAAIDRAEKCWKTREKDLDNETS